MELKQECKLRNEMYDKQSIMRLNKKAERMGKIRSADQF